MDNAFGHISDLIKGDKYEDAILVIKKQYHTHFLYLETEQQIKFEETLVNYLKMIGNYAIDSNHEFLIFLVLDCLKSMKQGKEMVC